MKAHTANSTSEIGRRRPSGYRATAGDWRRCFAMMEEVFRRRFDGPKEDPSATRTWPDLVLIDGGPGQMNAALGGSPGSASTTSRSPVPPQGPDRNAGRERFFCPTAALRSSHFDPVLFMRRLRDEAHRFAIGTHRARRARRSAYPPLDDRRDRFAAEARCCDNLVGAQHGAGRLAEIERVPGSAKPSQKGL